ncbi:MAG: rhodanese-like domain-containing protein [Kineosporiaceae bacterium]
MAEVPEIPASDVPDDAVLVDVREDDEWQAGHAPGARHFPLSQVPSRLGEIPEGDVHVICRSGGRSARAVAWLRENGVDAVNVGGGMQDWAAAGRPVVTDDGDGPGRVI